MKYSLSAFVGALIAVMVLMNGILAGFIGNDASSIVIHLIGIPVVALAMLVQRIRPRLQSDLPLYFYCAGVLGFLTIIFTNFSFSQLGVSLPVALGLFGQTTSSLIIDRYGLLGIEPRPFAKEKLPGIGLALVGILLMMFL